MPGRYDAKNIDSLVLTVVKPLPTTERTEILEVFFSGFRFAYGAGDVGGETFCDWNFKMAALIVLRTKPSAWGKYSSFNCLRLISATDFE
jgi:hypothetical protein